MQKSLIKVFDNIKKSWKKFKRLRNDTGESVTNLDHPDYLTILDREDTIDYLIEIIEKIQKSDA